MTLLPAAAAAVPVTAAAPVALSPPIETVMNVKVRRYYGYAYDSDSGRYLYTEVHVQRYVANGRELGGTIDYYTPDRRRIAHKTLDFSADPYVPLYRLDDVHPTYDEGISKITSGKIYLFKQTNSDQRPRRRTVDRRSDMVADAGLSNYVRDHFGQLMAGEKLNLTLVVAGKLDSYDFRMRRLSDTTFDGRPAVRFRLELASLLRWIVQPIVATYDPRTRRILEYRGVGDVLNPRTGKVYRSVRILYSKTPPPGAPKLLPPLD